MPGDGIVHFGSVRIRVVGTGNLRLTFYSLDDVESQTLPIIAMSAATNRQPTVLANFQQQRAALKGETTGIGEYFRVNRVIIFRKPLWSGYPG